MITLREPRIQDVPFVVECYADWPLTMRTGYITFDKVENWVKRWILRDDEVVWIAETDAGEAVGLIKGRYANWPIREYTPIDTEYPWAMAFWYLIPKPVAIVDDLIVHPNHRGNGYSDQIALLAWEKVPAEIRRSEFAVMQNTPFAAHTERGDARPGGKYIKIGEREGETGTLIVGERQRPEDGA